MDPGLIIRRKLYEQVAHYIENQILEGVLTPGDRLPPEREIQELFGVGRPAVREALISLQQKGLVRIGNGGPARVMQATADDVLLGIAPALSQMMLGQDGHKQLQGIRRFAEIGLARNAAKTLTPELLAEIDEALDRNRRAIGDPEGFARTDVGFHYVLAKAIGNPAFLVVHDAISGWLSKLRSVALRKKGFDKTSYEEHIRVRDAIASGDPDRAEDVMAAHLDSGAEVYWKIVESGELAQPKDQAVNTGDIPA